MAGSFFSKSVNAPFRVRSRASLSACAEIRAGTRPPGQTDAFQGGSARKHKSQRLYVVDQSDQDDAALVGMECRPGGEINRRSPVVGHEGPQPKVPDGQLPVGRTRRVPGAVASQGRGTHGDLFGQPADERSGQIIAVQPTLAGVTKKRDMNRQSKPVFSASPRADQIQIVIGQNDNSVPAMRCRRESRTSVSRAEAGTLDGVKPLACPENAMMVLF